MENLNDLLEESLEKTFSFYLTHAIEHAVLEDTTANILQVVINTQAALELLSKLYILRRKGWKGVVNQKFHSKSEKDLISLFKEGKIITIAYWKTRKNIEEEIELFDIDTELLNKFQEHRNNFIHLGVIEISNELLHDSLFLLVRVFHQLEWHFVLPMNKQYLSNSMQELIGHDLFEKLIKESAYIDEAVDRAFDISEGPVRYCIECGNESLIENTFEELQCLVCGFKSDIHTIGFIDCPLCNARSSLYYDRNNIELNKTMPSKCGCCAAKIEIYECSICKDVRPCEAGNDLCPDCQRDQKMLT